jgi:hypothetical protein
LTKIQLLSGILAQRFNRTDFGFDLYGITAFLNAKVFSIYLLLGQIAREHVQYNIIRAK